MKSFQLEEQFPGTFFLQGLAGGAFGGLLYVLLLTWANANSNSYLAIFLVPFCMGIGGVIGMIEAIVFWGVYRLSGIEMGARTRATAASIAATLFVMVIGVEFDFSESSLSAWLLLAASIGIPAALFVGSPIKPWD